MGMRLKGAHGSLRGWGYGGGDSIQSGHQVWVVRQRQRSRPEWTKRDDEIRAVLLRSFPKIRDESSALCNGQRKRAGLWMRFIQLYWIQSGNNAGDGSSDHPFPDPGQVITLKDVADEMKISLAAAKSLRVRIERAGRGIRCDGRGVRRR
jgi:hypothetical protein